jgi:hypothetical protein
MTMYEDDRPEGGSSWWAFFLGMLVGCLLMLGIGASLFMVRSRVSMREVEMVRMEAEVERARAEEAMRRVAEEKVQQEKAAADRLALAKEAVDKAIEAGPPKDNEREKRRAQVEELLKQAEKLLSPRDAETLRHMIENKEPKQKDR